MLSILHFSLYFPGKLPVVVGLDGIVNCRICEASGNGMVWEENVK